MLPARTYHTFRHAGPTPRRSSQRSALCVAVLLPHVAVSTRAARKRGRFFSIMAAILMKPMRDMRKDTPAPRYATIICFRAPALCAMLRAACHVRVLRRQRDADAPCIDTDHRSLLSRGTAVAGDMVKVRGSMRVRQMSLARGSGGSARKVRAELCRRAAGREAQQRDAQTRRSGKAECCLRRRGADAHYAARVQRLCDARAIPCPPRSCCRAQ